jgi:uncharacterized membrane protein
MIGATVITAIGAIVPALFPFVAGCLTATVAYARTKIVPLPAKSTEGPGLVEHRV